VARSASVDALRLLARRELSERQVRERLQRLGHASQVIDEAIAPLKESRAIDDGRTAGAIARAEAAARRGARRARQRLAAAGIEAAVAERAVDEVFGEMDTDTMIAEALDRRLRGRDLGVGSKEFARIYRHLVGRGFESDRVLRVLSGRARRSG
jgi:regulatory protein